MKPLHAHNWKIIHKMIWMRDSCIQMVLFSPAAMHVWPAGDGKPEKLPLIVQRWGIWSAKPSKSSTNWDRLDLDSRVEPSLPQQMATEAAKEEPFLDQHLGPGSRFETAVKSLRPGMRGKPVSCTVSCASHQKLCQTLLSSVSFADLSLFSWTFCVPLSLDFGLPNYPIMA